MEWQAIISALFFAGAFFWGACPCCASGCTYCQDPTHATLYHASDAPTQIAFTINGFTDGGGSNCANRNGTYIHTFVSTSQCGGITSETDSPTTAPRSTTSIISGIGGTTQTLLTIDWKVPLLSLQIIWRLLLVSPPCTAVIGTHSVPVISGGSDFWCNYDGSNLSVSVS